MVWARLHCSRLQCFLSSAHSGEGGGSSPEMLQTLRSTKKLQNGCFFKLFVRVSGCESLGCSGALTSVLSSYARTEEDIIVSRVESGQYAVLERVAGAAQRCPRCSRAPKSFKMTAFQSFS